MRRLTTIVAVTMVLAACGRPPGPRAGAQQERQRDRIQEGVDSGELTHKESRELRNQQRDIQADRRDARSDGVVTPKERRRIRNEQKAASKDIYEQKNDDDTR